MTPETFLDGRVTLWGGDNREALKRLADGSIDAVVTDPPYALVSIGKRFGKPGAKNNSKDAYKRASAGFMGKQWDTGEVAFATEFWAEVFRVLKPGGHVIAASGTRTYHRLACAIEDAGFEIRDQIEDLFSLDGVARAFLESLVASAFRTAPPGDFRQRCAAGGIRSPDRRKRVRWPDSLALWFRLSEEPRCFQGDRQGIWGASKGYWNRQENAFSGKREYA